MKAKSIMIQGTASDAGKSTLALALCRHYAAQKLNVFPFKSQNMGSASVYTIDGFEMSRPQWLQAEAAIRPADVRMNPILLKPTDDESSELIFLGRSRGCYAGRDYYQFKEKLKKKIKAVYQEVEQENDLVIIEGAGNPAEINLNRDDFVNMGMADMADSPVILVADIDLGGVFASIYGTVELQEKHHRQRIKGIIINKFRGDISLLRDGLDMIEDLINIPVLGVVPMIDLNLLGDREERDRQYDRLAAEVMSHIDQAELDKIIFGESGVV